MRISLQNFNPQRPLGFIVFEGVNGSGKSTLLKAVHQWFVENNIDSLVSQEPGGTPLGAHLRKLLLETPSSERTPLAESLLFSADRAEHVQKIIHPALEQRKFVLLDRYYYSTVSFQGYGHGLSIKSLLQLSQIATKNLLPDIVFLLDIDPAVGLKRNINKEEIDSFEKEDMNFHHKIRKGFLKLADSLPEPFVVLDAERSPTDIQNEVFEYLAKLTP